MGVCCDHHPDSQQITPTNIVNKKLSMALCAVTVLFVGGCAELRAITGCVAISALANNNSRTYSGTVNGKPYRNTVSWRSQEGDPGYFDSSDCVSQAVRNIKQKEAEEAALAAKQATEAKGATAE